MIKSLFKSAKYWLIPTVTLLAIILGSFQVKPTDLITTSPTTSPTSTSPRSSQVTSPSSSILPDLSLDNPLKKDYAMRLVSSAENSTLDWRAQYSYIEDINDGRGYTGGIIGFSTGTGDMLEVFQHYEQTTPGNILTKYLPALQRVNGTASHQGLDASFVNDWKTAATQPAFQAAQDWERDRLYFDPAVAQAKADGLRALGQFIYYDAIVMHGPGSDPSSFGGIRATALTHAKPPSQGGDETIYLNAFLQARRTVMLTETDHSDTSRLDTMQQVFLRAGNFDLNPPLVWRVYSDQYRIDK